MLWLESWRQFSQSRQLKTQLKTRRDWFQEVVELNTQLWDFWHNFDGWMAISRRIWLDESIDAVTVWKVHLLESCLSVLSPTWYNGRIYSWLGSMKISILAAEFHCRGCLEFTNVCSETSWTFKSIITKFPPVSALSLFNMLTI
jgi:hypothetical protein